MGQAQQKRRAILIVEDDVELHSLAAALFQDEQLDTIECESALLRGLAPRSPRLIFRLLRFRLNVMGNYEPAPIDFLVDVRDNVVHLLISAVLHFWCPVLLPHFPREIAVNVNVLIRQRDISG
jgi:hypothetical protein